MKRVLMIIGLCLGLVLGAAAMASAEDGASLYKMCQGCHGAQGEKLAMGVGAPLKGQSSQELYDKMIGYKDGSYGGSKKMIMTNLVKRLNNDQLKVLSDYIAGF